MFVEGTKITHMLEIRNIRGKRVKARFVCVDGPDGVAVVTLLPQGLDFRIRGSLGLHRNTSIEERAMATREQAEGYRAILMGSDKMEIVEVK